MNSKVSMAITLSRKLRFRPILEPIGNLRHIITFHMKKIRPNYGPNLIKLLNKFGINNLPKQNSAA